MSHLSASEIVDNANDHLCHVTEISLTSGQEKTNILPGISENAGSGDVVRYDGEDCLIGIPTRNDIVAENDEGLTAILEDALSKRQDIPFMAVDVEESTKFINGQAWYVLRLYGPLINGQKAVVTISGIQVFFDILVPILHREIEN